LLPAGANRRVGLAPTGKRRLFTAHAVSGHSWDREPSAGFDFMSHSLSRQRAALSGRSHRLLK
jgi:hypothetical protein